MQGEVGRVGLEPTTHGFVSRQLMLCKAQTIFLDLQGFSEIFFIQKTIYGVSFKGRLLSTLLSNFLLKV
jgi:hypothetical protein